MRVKVIVSQRWNRQCCYIIFKFKNTTLMSLSIQLQKKLEPAVPWEDITCILWHNGMLFSTVTSNYDTSTGCNGKVNVWDKDLNALGVFRAHEYGIYHMCYGPDDTIYTCASDSTICHWQCLSSSSLASTSDMQFKLLNVLKGHLEPPWKMQFFNNKLYSADELGEIRLWKNDSYVGVMETYEEVWDMIVIPKYLFTVRNLDVTVTSMPEDELKKACSIQNTIPGRGPLFVSGDRIACMHRTKFDIMVHSISESRNPLLKVFSGHASLINGFTGSNPYLFSGDYDGKIMVWDLEQLEKITEICMKENRCVNAMAYEPASKVLYVAQENKCLSKLVFDVSV